MRLEGVRERGEREGSREGERRGVHLISPALMSLAVQRLGTFAL